jgi:uncharacterized membrane protein YfcA
MVGMGALRSLIVFVALFVVVFIGLGAAIERVFFGRVAWPSLIVGASCGFIGAVVGNAMLARKR